MANLAQAPPANQRWKRDQQSLRLPPLKQTHEQALIHSVRKRRRRSVARSVRVSSATAAQPRRPRQLRYASETMRPIVCLAFVLPLLLFHEFGSIFADHVDGKSGVDRWLNELMQPLGIGQLVILPILTAGGLIVWHHRKSDRWNFPPQVLFGMVVESCGWVSSCTLREMRFTKLLRATMR